MPLSPREERALATLEDALRADDPDLAAVLRGEHPGRPGPAVALVALRPVVHLVAALLVLVVAAALLGPRLGVLGAAALTAVVVLPWLVVTARGAGRGTAGRPGRSVLGVGSGPAAVGLVVLLVGLATLPPFGQALLGLVILLGAVPWLALRVLTRRDRGTPR